MVRFTTQVLTVAVMLATSAAFTPSIGTLNVQHSSFPRIVPSPRTSATRLYESQLTAEVGTKAEEETVASAEPIVTQATAQEATESAAEKAAKTPAPKKAAPKNNHKEGVFSPLVVFMKEVMGDENLNKLRGKAISVHSNVIGSFVDTSDSRFGDAVLRALFRVADANNDGTISKDELQAAFQSLGFEWLQEKQVQGIFKRADTDGNGTIDMEEWVQEAPKTLRTNLTKLAKKNGSELGLLS
ncbi:Calcium binding protein [Seminavis robusta]|uniref:Calcium binding protein n=1 Tax=Seminavis robusta TaxID=568900 RepID=A0A9N8DE53_9STRA|nr:Calcium binding protein [Seminavis robusta]|eukprot:Sro97_g050180.1 Calcium binding protein (242) ;mRNA; r:108266-108991